MAQQMVAEGPPVVSTKKLDLSGGDQCIVYMAVDLTSIESNPMSTIDIDSVR